MIKSLKRILCFMFGHKFVDNYLVSSNGEKHFWYAKYRRCGEYKK